MSETIYVLTLLYCVYVVDEAEGDKIVKFGKDVLHIDATKTHKTYRSIRDGVLNSINSKSVSAV